METLIFMELAWQTREPLGTICPELTKGMALNTYHMLPAPVTCTVSSTELPRPQHT